MKNQIMMHKHSGTGKDIAGFGHAARGIREAAASQRNFRFHLFATALVVVAGIVIGISPTEWAVLMLAAGMVLAAECFNTAVEYLTDLVSPQYHELARKTKDLAAGAVLLVAVAAAAAGLLVFGPRAAGLLG